jgi:hypothetical protein
MLDNQPGDSIGLSGEKVEVDVVQGTEGYIYLVGGAQTVLKYIVGEQLISSEAFERFSANLDYRSGLASAVGAKFIHCVCPDKHSAIPEHFPFTASVSVGREFQRNCRTSFVFPIDALRSSGSSFGYLKTDTHWNFSGRLAVAQALIRHFGIDETEIQAKRGDLNSLKHSYQTYCGDLGNKMHPKPSEAAEVSLSPDQHRGVHFFSNKIAGNNGLINVYYNLVHKGEARLLVFGDSFIIHCLPMLALFFKTTLFLRSPYLHPEIVSMFEPTHVLTSNAERYLPKTTRDSDAPLGLLMASLAGKAWNCDVVHARAINASLQPKGPHSRNFWADIRKLAT